MKLNSNQNIYFWLFVILLLLLEIPLVLWVQKTTGFSNKTKEESHRLRSLADALSLTEKQVDFFSLNEKEYSNLIYTLHRQMKMKNKMIADKIFEVNYDSSKLNQLIHETGIINDEINKVRFKYLRKLKTVLNKDQLDKFKEIINESLIEWTDTLIVPYNDIYPPGPRKIF